MAEMVVSLNSRAGAKAIGDDSWACSNTLCEKHGLAGQAMDRMGFLTWWRGQMALI